MKHATLEEASDRLLVGHRPPAHDPEASPSWQPLWRALDGACELILGHSVVGCLGYACVLALGGAIALGAQLAVPEHALPVALTGISLLGVGVIFTLRWSGRRLTREAGRAELTPAGVRFAKPQGDRKRIPWDYVQGFRPHSAWVQLRIGDRERPQHAIPTPTPEERQRVLAYLAARGVAALG